MDTDCDILAGVGTLHAARFSTEFEVIPGSWDHFFKLAAEQMIF